MRENVYIQGLNRQAKYFGLPLPLAITAFLPGFYSFILFDSFKPLILIPIMWLSLWLATLVNPHFVRFISVALTKTPECCLRQRSVIKYE